MSERVLAGIRDLIRQANRWLQALATPEVRKPLEAILAAGPERRAYQAINGSVREVVAKVAGVSHQTVSNYWKGWRELAPAHARSARAEQAPALLRRPQTLQTGKG